MKKITFIGLILSIPMIAFADIYKWTDEQGNIHISDTPTELTKNAEKIIEEKKPILKPYEKIYEERIYPKPQITYQAPTIQPQIKVPLVDPNIQAQINRMNKMIEEEKKKAEVRIKLISWGLTIYSLLWLTALIDILKNEFIGQNKVVWIITITFIPIIGLIAYSFYGIDQKIKHVD